MEHLVVLLAFVVASVTAAGTQRIATDAFGSVSLPGVCLVDVPFTASFQLEPYAMAPLPSFLDIAVSQGSRLVNQSFPTQKDGVVQVVYLIDGLVCHKAGLQTIVFDIRFSNETKSLSVDAYGIPGVLSLIPPLVTVIISVAIRQVTVALLLGIWLAAFFVSSFNPLTAFLRTLDYYWVRSLASNDHAAVILFTIFLGGLIGVVSKGGGARGLGQFASKFATSAFSAKACIFALSLAIFFDDYSEILIVGSTMRTVVPNYAVSRAKFAFMIHAVGSALASMMPVSSWTGVEVGYIAEQYTDLGIADDPFVALLSSIPRRYFPVLMIVFVFLNLITRRDFGPMLASEREALATHNSSTLDTMGLVQGPLASDEPTSAVDPDPTKPMRATNAVVPFVSVVIVTFLGMYLDGYYGIKGMPDPVPVTLVNVFSNAHAVSALLWASGSGCIIAIALLIPQRILSLSGAMESWVAGVMEVVEPIVILMLAWALGMAIGELHTANYIVGGVGHLIHPGILPLTTALAAYVMSFACGSAFGTQAILFPLVLPLAAHIGTMDTVLSSVSAILGGSIFGNVCSPIADNTVLASLATGCDITEHVRTMAAYVALTGMCSLIFGDLLVGFGVYPPPVGLLVGAVVLAAVLLVFGSPIDPAERTWGVKWPCSKERADYSPLRQYSDVS